MVVVVDRQQTAAVMKFPWWWVAVVLCHISLWVLWNDKVPGSYMDEIFHIPQAIWTMQGSGTVWESWDKNITTFPGLYYFTAWILAPLRRYGIETTPVFVLRGVNALVVGPSTFLVLQDLSGRNDCIDIHLLPIHFFYHFLFYTDSLSTLSVLLSLALHRRGWHALAGAAGVIAVGMRQTNIVWVFGFALAFSIDAFMKKKKLFLAVEVIVRKLFFHITAGLGFLFFMYCNNWSIVLGHNAYHSMSLHMAQMGYLVLSLVGIGGGPAEVLDIVSSLRSCPQWRRVGILFLILSFCGIVGSIGHPFLLADNRHLTFYIWKRVLRHRIVQVVVVPLLASLCVVHSKLFKRDPLQFGAFGKEIWWLCSAIALVPSPLLEFRYFNIPILLVLCAGVRKWSWPRVVYPLLVNAAVIVIFLYFPFPDVYQDVQRFMW